MKDKETTIQIKFANKEAAKYFAEWLCGAGEQDYWNWMECREEDEDGNITVIDFNYHGKDKENPKFMVDNIIRTTCGRLNK